MKTIRSWSHLEEFGIVLLTGEACSLMYRILFDLTASGKAIVERCLSVTIASEPWNSGPASDPHVASIMLPREMLTPLAVFALLESGCGEVWIAEQAAFGIEAKDTEEQVDMMKRCHKPHRRFAYHGPFQNRNQHQMSGRVRMRITLLEAKCGMFLLQAEDGRTILVQTDWDFPGVAETFGWSLPAGTEFDDTGKVVEESLSTVVSDARDFLHERAGDSTSDPGYF